LAKDSCRLSEIRIRTKTRRAARSRKGRTPATPEGQKKREERKKRREAARARAEYDRKFNNAALAKLQEMGAKLVPVEMPKFPYDAMVTMLTAEAAAAFDELTRSGKDKLLTSQKDFDWPNAFRTARFIPAVEYIQAARARRMAMDAVTKVFDDFDVIVAPTSGEQLVITNLTGHPAVILPNGLRGSDAPKSPNDDPGDFQNAGGPGTPASLTFLGNCTAKRTACVRPRLPGSHGLPSPASEAGGSVLIKIRRRNRCAGLQGSLDRESLVGPVRDETRRQNEHA